MSLNITIPDTFNGPLDLLLHLIRRDEMDIFDIPIARLLNSYLEEIERQELINMDEGVEFLDLASQLSEIKLRMLLPPEDRMEEGDEEDEDFDPRSGLVAALLEYRRFKDAARLLGEMAEEQARRYPRIAPRLELRFVDDAGQTADCLDLLTAFQSMLDKMVGAGDSADVISSTEVSISVRIQQIETVLAQIESTRFSLLLSGTPNRGEMVGFFVAILELIRRGRLTARQSGDFSDIILERRAPAPEAARASAPRRCRVSRCFPAAAGATGKKGETVPKRAVSIFPAAAGARSRGTAAPPSRTPPPFPAAGIR